MAAANAVRSLQEEATCSICLEYFTDPVTTQCGHNFCRPCATACTEGDGTALSCPQCRELCSQGDLRANRQLQSIVELVKQLSVQQQRPPREELLAEQGKRPPVEDLCAEHEERLKLFCKEEKKLICVICRESKKHREHKVLPIKEAAEEYKAVLQEWVQTLNEELEAVQKDKQEEDEDCIALMDKLEAERNKIKTEFQELQQLLKEQEQTLLGRLEEIEKKIAIDEKANIVKLAADMAYLEALITEVEKKCEQPTEELLKDIRSTLDRCENVMEQAPVRNFKKYKVRVTLNRHTADDWLALSDRWRCVRCIGGRKFRRDYRSRYTFYLGVVGEEGFTSGRHYWDLELVQDGDWIVGVVRESVKRSEPIITLCPEKGAWTVTGCNGQYWANTSPELPLSPRQHPMKLGVYLDYEGGRLAVYNTDTMKALYTFTGAAFNGRVYPFFDVGERTELYLL